MTYKDGFEVETKREYKGNIAIEQLVTAQINRIMEYGTRKMKEEYEEGIELLVDLLSPEHEEQALAYKEKYGIYYDITRDGLKRYKALFRFIKRLPQSMV